MGETRFGYALGNGTVGVYDRSNRYWRIKVNYVIKRLKLIAWGDYFCNVYCFHFFILVEEPRCDVAFVRFGQRRSERTDHRLEQWQGLATQHINICHISALFTNIVTSPVMSLAGGCAQ